jgi:hypothetical protein
LVCASKQADFDLSVANLKTDGGRMARDTHRDLVA